MECVAKKETGVNVHLDGPGSSATGVSMRPLTYCTSVHSVLDLFFP